MVDVPSVWQTLTKDATGLSVLVAFGALLASAISAAVSAWVGHETRVIRRAQTEGDVIVYLEQSSQVFQAADLVIRNVGPGAAWDVTAIPDSPWPLGDQESGDARELATVGFVKHGIPLLAPGQTVRTFIGMATDVMRRPTRQFTLAVTFRPAPGRAVERRQFRIDFAYLDEISQVGSPLPVAAADALTKIARDVERVVSAQGYLRTDVRTEHDRQRQSKEIRRLHAERQARSTQTPSTEHGEE